MVHENEMARTLPGQIEDFLAYARLYNKERK